MRCPACDTSNPPEALRCQACGEKLPRHNEEDEDDDGLVSTIIPYRNPKALAAYYCGFFALIPAIGIFIGLVAVVLGIMGLRYTYAHPSAKGTAHAITGIVLGLVSLPCNVIVSVLLWITYISKPF
jgi:hypothetical protein